MKKIRLFIKRLLCCHYWRTALLPLSQFEIEMRKELNMIWVCSKCGKRIVRAVGWLPINFYGDGVG